MPVTLDPATAVTTLRGPEPSVAGLVRSFVLQLGGYAAARRTRILIHGPTPPLLAARFLPAAILSAQEASTLETLAAGPGRDYERGVLIIVAALRPAVLRSAAVSRGWQVIDCAGDPAPAPGAALVLTERTARLSSAGSSLEFTPDLVPCGVFDRNCRRLRARAPASAPGAGIPGDCSLGGLLPVSAEEVSARWAGSTATRGLPAVVGVGRSGPLRLDLMADGPHVLVAGTTGSGKSEFLRTLAAALAAAHPPDRVNLLFIDFKGGSGLRPLAGLAHCVGLLTDLDLDEVARTLVSLAAEVRRREVLLASHQAADLTAYEALDPHGPPLPHLVLIIDEFRMLVDEAPDALAELMRIAAIGRSLGIHLIMATQRPQGAVSADIRANVTSCIALRVQSELESLDIINSRLAAAIPVTSPGRAYLVRGNEAPEEFQTATLTSPVPETSRGPTVAEAMEVLNRPPAAGSPVRSGGGAAPPSATPSPALARLAEAVTAAWAAAGGPTPRRPVAVPLPRQVPFPADGDRGRIRLGLLDLPEEQRVSGFGWDPGTDGHLGLVSGFAGGADAALGLIVGAAPRRRRRIASVPSGCRRFLQRSGHPPQGRRGRGTARPSPGGAGAGARLRRNDPEAGHRLRGRQALPSSSHCAAGDPGCRRSGPDRWRGPKTWSRTSSATAHGRGSPWWLRVNASSSPHGSLPPFPTGSSCPPVRRKRGASPGPGCRPPRRLPDGWWCSGR